MSNVSDTPLTTCMSQCNWGGHASFTSSDYQTSESWDNNSNYSTNTPTLSESKEKNLLGNYGYGVYENDDAFF